MTKVTEVAHNCVELLCGIQRRAELESPKELFKVVIRSILNFFNLNFEVVKLV